MPGPAPHPAGVRLELDNDACEACHEVEAAQWRGSQHQTAYTEREFQRALAHEPMPFCRGCHAPEADPRLRPAAGLPRSGSAASAATSSATQSSPPRAPTSLRLTRCAATLASPPRPPAPTATNSASPTTAGAPVPKRCSGPSPSTPPPPGRHHLQRLSHARPRRGPQPRLRRLARRPLLPRRPDRRGDAPRPRPHRAPDRRPPRRRRPRRPHRRPVPPPRGRSAPRRRRRSPPVDHRLPRPPLRARVVRRPPLRVERSDDRPHPGEPPRVLRFQLDPGDRAHPVAWEVHFERVESLFQEREDRAVVVGAITVAAGVLPPTRP
ncbi:multiheme c-type cytochrome [Nannocystis pusilla]|uniref:multiheme c-type cytochrome n=1 Tax=Nannocystis pusilla TaxID=889268 RepID=UPI003B80C6E7